MYDYGYPSYDTGASVLGGLFASMGLMMLISSAVTILAIVSQWKIYKKAGKNGWECLIPIYNFIVLLEIVELPMWYIILLIVPFANIYAMFKIYIELAHKFGKSTGFGVLTVFFTPICLPILAFGKDCVYQGGNNNQTNQTNNMVPPMNNMNPQYNQMNNMNNMNQMNNVQNSGETVMFTPIMNTNINPMPNPTMGGETPQQSFVNPTTIPTPVEPVIPTPVSEPMQPTINLNQPVVDPVIPTTPISQPMPETNTNQNVGMTNPEPMINTQVNTVTGSIPTVNEPQVINSQPTINNPVNNFNQDNNQNM